MERYNFQIVSGHLPETMRKLFFRRYPHQEITRNYGILRNNSEDGGVFKPNKICDGTFSERNWQFLKVEAVFNG